MSDSAPQPEAQSRSPSPSREPTTATAAALESAPPAAAVEQKNADPTDAAPASDQRRSRSASRSRSRSRSRSSRHRSGRSHRSHRSEKEKGSSGASGSAARRSSRSTSRNRNRSPTRSRSRSRSRSSDYYRSSRRRRHHRSRDSRSRSRSRSRDRRRRSYSRSRSRSPHRSTGSKFDKNAIASVLNAPPAFVVAPVDPQLTRQCRRLYVGNLPVVLHLTEQQITDIFSSTIIALGITTPQPIISTWLSAEGTFCFVEFRSIQDTSYSLALLQGLQIGGRTLRIGRPQDYKLPAQHLLNHVVGLTPGMPSRQDRRQHAQRDRDDWNCLSSLCMCLSASVSPAPPTFINNIPFMQLLSAGQSPLTNPSMMMLLASPPQADPNAASAPPATPAVTTTAPITAPAPDTALPPAAPAPAPAPAASPASSVPTPVLLLENMVTLADLCDDAEFSDLMLDIKDEVAKFGPVLNVIIPRPHIPNFAPATNSAPSTEEAPRVAEGAGTGRIFVHYQSPDSAAAAMEKLNGRTFNASKVVASFYDVDKLMQKKYI